MLVTELFATKDPLSIKLAIRATANRKLSSRERTEQRISFVMASVSTKGGITREQVRRAITG